MDGTNHDSTKSEAKAREQKSERHSMRLYPQDFDTLVYWSERFDMDRTELLVTAMHHYIKHRNGDYDIPTAEIQRLNQLVDAMNSLVATNETLQTTITSGFNGLMGVVRGDNYLVEPDKGDR